MGLQINACDITKSAYVRVNRRRHHVWPASLFGRVLMPLGLVVASACAAAASPPAESSKAIPSKSVSTKVESYQDCIAAGNRILRTYPPQCVTRDGRIFREGADGAVSVVPKSASTGAAPVCVNRCGDGVCQEIVCQAEGCPCAESSATCPTDCRR